MSYITQPELDSLDASTLPRETAFLIQGVSNSMFSLAWYYGGATVQGAAYIYLPLSDELIRADVLKWLAKHRKATLKADQVTTGWPPSALMQDDSRELSKALSNGPDARRSARDAGDEILGNGEVKP